LVFRHDESFRGFVKQPVRVTYSSDYFPELYDFAVQLIKSGHAYVCHQTKEQVNPHFFTDP
jgi:glutaminyl-tRNA synthetase